MVGRVESLLTRLGLPTRLPPTMNVGRLVEGMQLDKKARGGKVQFVLLAGIGKPVIARDVSVSDIEAELGK
jgi:3-dehydroquinate synthase